MPVWAVISRGRLSVNSGSTSTTFGTIKSDRKLFLNGGSNDEMTAFLVASVPVPAVVGIASKGRGGRSIVSPRPTPSRKSLTESPCRFVARAATAFARSIADPPPIATTQSPSRTPRLINRSTAASTSVTSGSRVCVANRSVATPAECIERHNSSIVPFASSVREPLMTKAREPSDFASEPISVRRPQPKTMRFGAKKSYGTSMATTSNSNATRR